MGPARGRPNLNFADGNFKRAIDTLELENAVYQSENTKAHKKNSGSEFGVHLMEGFAGSAHATQRAHLFGLTAVQPVDLIYGFDLASGLGRARWKQAIRRHRPLLVVLGFPCTKWCFYNYAINFRNKPELLATLQDQDRPLLKLVVWTALEQARNGRIYLLENPVRSIAWEQPEFQPLWDLASTQMRIGDSCPFNLRASDGKLMLKKRKWVSNDSDLLDAVCLRCTRDHEHTEVSGTNTRQSQEFTPELADAILTYLQREACERQPHLCAFVEADTRFAWSVHKVDPDLHAIWYVDYDRSETEWLQAITAANLYMSERGISTWVVPAGHEVHQMVADLVPWELVQVQAARMPKARRSLNNALYTHRGLVLLTHSDVMRFESDAVDQVRHPRLRFTEPIQFAFYFYGNAPEAPAPAPQPPDIVPEEAMDPMPEPPVEGVSADAGAAHDAGEGPPEPPPPPAAPAHDYVISGTRVTFPGLTQDRCPRDITQAVARLHCNQGHPSKEDLKRFVSWQGAKPVVFMAIDFMRCEACARHPKLSRARPTTGTIRYLGMFGEKLQGDCFTVVDTANRTRWMLGLICVNTDLHKVGRMVDRDPNTAFQIFCGTWVVPFGAPLEVLLDMDGTFLGDFKGRLESLGIYVNYCPPDAHWQIGKIERHNAAWRWIWNRTCDAVTAVTDEEEHACVIDYNEAKNNALRRSGR